MSKLKLGTPDADLSMSVTRVTCWESVNITERPSTITRSPWDKTVEFTINPPSPLSHAMTLYAPYAHVSFEPISANSSLGDMRITNADGDTMFIIKSE